MRIIEKLEFDEVCQKNTVRIAFLAAVLMLSYLIGRTAGAAAELAGALAACGMLTMYIDMAVHAFCKAASAERAAEARILPISDAAAEILKLIYILTPFTVNALPLRLAVLTADAALSRIYRFRRLRTEQWSATPM